MRFLGPYAKCIVEKARKSWANNHFLILPLWYRYETVSIRYEASFFSSIYGAKVYSTLQYL